MGEQKDAIVQEERERPRLRLKRDVPGKPCPRCGEKMAEDAVVCLHCGWNVQTGKKVYSAEGEMRRKRVLGAVMKGGGALVAAGVLAVAVHWVLGHRGEAEQWIGEGVEKAKTLAGVEGTRAGETAEDREAREARERERLDAEMPMWRVGDTVELEKANGALLKGTLSQAGDGTVTVETASGPQTADMGALSGRSRARVDGAFRETVIRKRAENAGAGAGK